ncbi:hypothetical protein chiPu_0009690 [Chiloscyllium punctatum]|uniref:Uncharacterized protein n=1 Tax=Chiloscyllium punctatum TaxID=137246 RepID=A0A401SLG6_CHIPU|nr:hypothetical protein [Chiloscyllium punctatum]
MGGAFGAEGLNDPEEQMTVGGARRRVVASVQLVGWSEAADVRSGRSNGVWVWAGIPGLRNGAVGGAGSAHAPSAQRGGRGVSGPEISREPLNVSVCGGRWEHVGRRWSLEPVRETHRPREGPGPGTTQPCPPPTPGRRTEPARPPAPAALTPPPCPPGGHPKPLSPRSGGLQRAEPLGLGWEVAERRLGPARPEGRASRG